MIIKSVGRIKKLDKLSNFLGSYQFYLSEQRKETPDEEKIDAAFEMCRSTLSSLSEDEIGLIYKEPVFSSVVAYIRAVEKRRMAELKKAQAV